MTAFLWVFHFKINWRAKGENWSSRDRGLVSILGYKRKKLNIFNMQ